MKFAYRLVVPLVSLQVVVTGFLWTLDPTGRGAQGTFATFLGVDLLVFAAISYLYRTDKSGDKPSKLLLFVGSCVFVVLLISSLFTA